MLINRHRLVLIFSILLISIAFLRPGFAYRTNGGNIFDDNNNMIAINGVAWIGFQDSNFLGGLWNVPFNSFGTQHGVIELLTAPWNVPGSNVASPNNGVAFKSIRLPIQPGNF